MRDRVVTLSLGSPATTWEYDGVVWTQVSTSSSPNGGAMVFDPSRGRVVLITGGMAGTNDTWEYDGMGWVLVTTTSPPLHYVASNHGLGRTVAFGGGSGAFPGTDLFQWTGAGWVLIPTTNQPPSRISPNTQIVYGSMAHDERRDRLVVFGEERVQGTLGSGPLANTWEWDSTNGWSNPAAGGPNRAGRLLFDRWRGVMTLLAYDNTVWQWDGVGQWTQVSTGTTPAGVPIFLPAHDSTRGRILAVPYDQLHPTAPATLWSLAPTRPAAYEPHGVGCNGAASGPELELAAPWTRPWLGSPWPFRVRVRGLPQSIALLATGLSDQSWLGAALPLDLAVVGMPGCLLHIAPEANVLAAGSAGTAEVALTLPLAPALLGQVFFQQAFALAPGANAAGVLASPSRRGVVGRW